MEQIKTEKELQARFEKCGACLQKKFHCEPGHKAIVVCGGTGLYLKAALYDYVFEDEEER